MEIVRNESSETQQPVSDLRGVSLVRDHDADGAATVLPLLGCVLRSDALKRKYWTRHCGFYKLPLSQPTRLRRNRRDDDDFDAFPK